MSIQNDLNFLATLAKSFLKQAHIKKTLAAIKEEEITGWEKWLQIEFATFLRSHDSVKEWNREIQHPLDKRIGALLLHSINSVRRFCLLVETKAVQIRNGFTSV